MNGILYFVLFLDVFACINGQNYCSLKSCKEGRHTMCRFPSSQPAAACGSVRSASLTDTEKNAILSRHNYLRAYVASGQERRGNPGPQPRAKNLGAMQWNNELETIAQRWADQCAFGHDECRNTQNGWVGQNIASISWSDTWHSDSLVQMVDNWYNEVKDFNSNLVSSINFNDGRETGHYTQLVWANSIYLGCGAVRYKNGQWYITYLVCNYSPGGNIIGQPVYQTA